MYAHAEYMDKFRVPPTCYFVGTEIRVSGTCHNFTDIYNSSCVELSAKS